MEDCKVQVKGCIFNLAGHTIFQYTADSEQLASGEAV